MAGNVTLSSAVRDNLLSLQSTSNLINQTQGRLSTGLKVGSPIDDPVSFFQAKALSDRAADFTAKKDNIDQGISTVTTALNATEGIEALVKQLKGLALSAKSASTAAEITNVVTQFNELKTQINNLANDASYQGLNLIAGTGQSLAVSFSNDTASQMTVASQDITTGVNGLNVTNLEAITSSSGLKFDYSGRDSTDAFSTGETISFTVANSAAMTIGTGTHTISYGTFSVTFAVGTAAADGKFAVASTGQSYTLSAGQVITFTLATAATVASGAYVSGLSAGTVSLGSDISGSTKIGVGFADKLNNLITDLEQDLTAIRSTAQQLGSNVALLQTRIDFTKSYVNTLTAGSGKLTLADLNEEGANLLALQTRQQLGIQALSFAGKAEQGILGLFR